MAPPEEEDDVVTPRPLTPTLYVAGPTGIAVINLANDLVEEVRNELTGPFVITPDGAFAFAHQRFPTGPLTKVDLQTYETTEVTGSVFLGGMAITPDGSRIYAILDEASVIRIDVAANRALLDNPITVGDSAVSIAIAPDGSRAYVANAVSEDISVIDLATDEVVATISDLSIPVYVAVNPTGDRLYVANSVTNGRVEVIDLNTLTVIATVPVGGSAGASAIAVTLDGTRAYIGTRGNSPPIPPGISIIDTATNALLGYMWPPAPNILGSVSAIAMTRDGENAYVTGNGPDIKHFELAGTSEGSIGALVSLITTQGNNFWIEIYDPPPSSQ